MTTPTLSRISEASPSQFRPLPQALRGTSCFSCNQLRSSWWVEAFEPVNQENKVYVCSLCLLYKTEWGRGARSTIEEVVRRVERSRNVEFETDDSNRLVRPRDADDILGVIVLSHRAAGLRARSLAR
jgi:hypothetical protein